MLAIEPPLEFLGRSGQYGVRAPVAVLAIWIMEIDVNVHLHTTYRFVQGEERRNGEARRTAVPRRA